MDNKDTTYSIDNPPEDAIMYTEQSKEYAPLDPGEIYQVEVKKAELRDNPFFKPDAEKPEDRGSKYQFSFEFVILNEGEFRDRRLWDTTGLALKPEGKRGPTKLYKIITRALKTDFGWDECNSFASDIKVFLKNLSSEIVGKQIRVSIENVKKPDGKIKSKIATYMEAKTDLPPFVEKDKESKNTTEAPVNIDDLPF